MERRSLRQNACCDAYLGEWPWDLLELDLLELIVKLCRGPPCLPPWRCLHRSSGASPPRLIRSRGPPQRTAADPASGTCSADRRAVLPMAIPAMWRVTTTIAIEKTWR